MKNLGAVLLMILSLLFYGCEETFQSTETPDSTHVCDEPTVDNAPYDNGDIFEPEPEKPVIYLYPEEETEVEVRLDYSGELTCTYPKYKDGWRVTAQPDGRLTDSNGIEYSYLYWEGSDNVEYDLSKGFCIAGEDTAEFLEGALSQLGLNRREANEFIVYWLPRMEISSYNLITFQSDTYTENAKLTVMPEPNTVIRVFMVWKPLCEKEYIEPQILTAPERQGFTVVEWGGQQISGRRHP